MRASRLIVRALIGLLALLAACLAAVSLLPPAYLAPLASLWYLRPPDPTPPPPTLLAPRGDLPAGPGGLQEWVRYRGEADGLAGSGFLLRLDDGRVVGVTTAHSLALGQPDRGLEQIAFAVAGAEEAAVEFDLFHGPPGRARTGGDLSVDYVLLSARGVVDPDLALEPDPRGEPQPGERVALFSGLGDGDGGRRVLDGTVQSADPQAIWVLFDGSFDPGRMSGSPLISRHTGRVVGMAVASAPRGGQAFLGFHPIGSIVRLAEAAAEYPGLAEYRP